MNMHTAEKIETIVDCFLRRGTTEGTMGSLVQVEAGLYRVVADGLTVIVRTPHRGGWLVKFKGFEDIDSELYFAARNALEGGAVRSVSTVAEALS